MFFTSPYHFLTFKNNKKMLKYRVEHIMLKFILKLKPVESFRHRTLTGSSEKAD
jgi:hypothetical protein